jgi:hypothetical protein
MYGPVRELTVDEAVAAVEVEDTTGLVVVVLTVDVDMTFAAVEVEELTVVGIEDDVVLEDGALVELLLEAEDTTGLVVADVILATVEADVVVLPALAVVLGVTLILEIKVETFVT